MNTIPGAVLERLSAVLTFLPEHMRKHEMVHAGYAGVFVAQTGGYVYKSLTAALRLSAWPTRCTSQSG